MSNLSKFFKEYEVALESAIPLIFIRTKEPRRLIDTVSAKYCSDLTKQGVNLHYWNFTEGDTKYNVDKSLFESDSKDIAPKEVLPSLTDKYKAITVENPDKRLTGINIFFYQWIEEMFKHPKVISQLWLIATKLGKLHQGFKHATGKAGEGVPKEEISNINNRIAKTFQFVIIMPFGEDIPDKLKSDSKIIDFDVPTRDEILKGVLAPVFDTIKNKQKSKKLDKVELIKDDIANTLCGMTQREASIAFTQSLMIEKYNNGGEVEEYDSNVVLSYLKQIKTDIIKQSECLELLNSIKREDVGGLDNLKNWIERRKNCFTDEAKKFGVETPKGVALIGPAGTGKSLSAKLISGILNYPLIKFDISSVFNKYVGSSETRVKQALKTIESISPCVVLIDEIDKIFNINEGGDSGVSKRVLAAILTHLQECDKPVFWVFTANRTDNLPAELLRKGRLDEIFGVTIPSDVERDEIIKIHFKKRGHDVSSIKFTKSIEASQGFVSSEIEQAVKDTLIDLFNDTLESKSGAKKNLKITDNTLFNHLKDIKPLSKVFSEQFNRMQEWAEQHAKPANNLVEKEINDNTLFNNDSDNLNI